MLTKIYREFVYNILSKILSSQKIPINVIKPNSEPFFKKWELAPWAFNSFMTEAVII